MSRCCMWAVPSASISPMTCVCMRTWQSWPLISSATSLSSQPSWSLQWSSSSGGVSLSVAYVNLHKTYQHTEAHACITAWYKDTSVVFFFAKSICLVNHGWAFLLGKWSMTEIHCIHCSTLSAYIMCRYNIPCYIQHTLTYISLSHAMAHTFAVLCSSYFTILSFHTQTSYPPPSSHARPVVDSPPPLHSSDTHLHDSPTVPSHQSWRQGKICERSW